MGMVRRPTGSSPTNSLAWRTFSVSFSANSGVCRLPLSPCARPSVLRSTHSLRRKSPIRKSFSTYQARKLFTISVLSASRAKIQLIALPRPAERDRTRLCLTPIRQQRGRARSTGKSRRCRPIADGDAVRVLKPRRRSRLPAVGVVIARGHHGMQGRRSGARRAPRCAINRPVGPAASFDRLFAPAANIDMPTTS